MSIRIAGEVSRLAAREQARKTRELSNRIASARSEIAAMLFFLVPSKGSRSPDVRQLRYLMNRQISNLIGLADSLRTGEFDGFSCEACGKPIRPRQAYAHDDESGVDLHARCAGLPAHKCQRMASRAERERDLKERLADARAYLARRGLAR